MYTDRYYEEFCESLEYLDRFTDAGFTLEAVNAPQNQLRKRVGTSTSRLKDSTRDTLAAYGNITDAGGDLIKGTWDLTFGAVTACTKVISYIVRRISMVPELILKTSSKVARIPADIRHKINGDIKLYIRVEDLSNLYNKNIIKYLDDFIGVATKLSEGDAWSTFFHNRDGKFKIATQRGDDDMKLCKDMERIYTTMKLMDFTQTTIPIKDDRTRNIYFGDEKSIKFTDLKGVAHECTYYEGLVQVMKDLQSRNNDLLNLQKVIGKKYDKSIMDQKYQNLTAHQKNTITKSIQMLSKVTNVIGSILRHTMADIKTIDMAADKILHHMNIRTKPKMGKK